jgi:hypothetical protein
VDLFLLGSFMFWWACPKRSPADPKAERLGRSEGEAHQNAGVRPFTNSAASVGEFAHEPEGQSATPRLRGPRTGWSTPKYLVAELI